MEHGADYVEQDLAVTRDGVLICLHDDTLERTSNVGEIYPQRFSEESAGQADAGSPTTSPWPKSAASTWAAGSTRRSPANTS